MLFREAATGVSVSDSITLHENLSSPKAIQLIHQNNSMKQSSLHLVRVLFQNQISVQPKTSMYTQPPWLYGEAEFLKMCES